MSTPHLSRAEARAHMESAIITAGREQLVSRGAANLSLREVARSIGVVSSAVYRYVSSRDELLTLLVVDAYSSLADHAESRIDGAGAATDRFRRLAFGMREWALDHREQWALLYGSPVPGYSAPADRTTGPGTRVIRLFLESIPSDVDAPEPSSGFAAQIRPELETLGVAASPTQAAFCIEAWGSIVGCISMEIFGQLGPAMEGLGEEIMSRTVDSLTRRLGQG